MNYFIVTASEAVRLFSSARLFAIPWTVAYQAPPSMEFSRQGTEWVAFPFFGDLATQGSNPGLLHFRQTLYCLSHHLLFSCPVSGNTLDAEPIRQKWPTMRVNVMTASPPKPSPPSLAAPAAQARTCSPSCAGRAASARASGRRSPRWPPASWGRPSTIGSRSRRARSSQTRMSSQWRRGPPAGHAVTRPLGCTRTWRKKRPWGALRSAGRQCHPLPAWFPCHTSLFTMCRPFPTSRRPQGTPWMLCHTRRWQAQKPLGDSQVALVVKNPLANAGRRKRRRFDP